MQYVVRFLIFFPILASHTGFAQGACSRTGPLITSLAPASGSSLGGTRVSLTPYDYCNGDYPAVNGKAIPYQSMDGAFLFTMPAGGTGSSASITIVRPAAGALASPPAAFTYISPPPGPSGLRVTSVQRGRVTLAWRSPSVVFPDTRIVVERSTDGSSFSSVGAVPGPQWSYDDTSLPPGVTTLYYRVYAASFQYGNSASSGTGRAVLTLPPLPAPPAALGLTLVGTSPTRLSASWKSGGGATAGFRIAVAAAGAALDCADGVDVGNQLAYTADGFSAGAVYRAQLCAYNGNGVLGAAVEASATFSPKIAAVTPSSGPSRGGTQVTVTGANFSRAATVSIGGAPCGSVTWSSPTKLTCITPRGNPGGASVVVTNPDSTSGSLDAGFQYVLFYPRGAYALQSIQSPIPDNVLTNPGIVGVVLQFTWREIEVEAPFGSGQWSFIWDLDPANNSLDQRISEASAAGLAIKFQPSLTPRNAPAWVLGFPNGGKPAYASADGFPSPARVQTIAMVDLNKFQKEYCTLVSGPVFWDPVYHAAKKAVIKALGARYAASTPGLVGTATEFVSWVNADWNVPHTGTSAAPVSFSCTGRDGIARTFSLTQQTDWLSAAQVATPSDFADKMFPFGQEILTAVASAFPGAAVTLPLYITLSDTDSALATRIADYGYASFPGRFLAQNDELYVKDPVASAVPPPNPTAIQLIFGYLARSSGSGIGLQMLAGAANGDGSNGFNGGKGDGCRENGGMAPCDPIAVTSAAVNIALTYKPFYLELWPQDAAAPEVPGAPDLRCPLWNATVCLGGAPRSVPASATPLDCPQPFACPMN